MSDEPILDIDKLAVVEVSTERLGATGCDERDQRIAALEAQLDALAAWACDQYDDGDEQFGRRAGVARGRELLAERDALKAELTRVRDLAEKDRAAFADTLCSHRTALRETREALEEMLNNGGCSTVEWMPLATIKTARSVLARHAGLVEEVGRG